MIETYAILTGSSRGIGAALARGLLRPGTQLVTVARRSDPALAELAKQTGAQLTQIEADLSDLDVASKTAEGIRASIPAGAKRYLLINNAGTLSPVASAANNTDAHAIAAALNLNVTAPMLLCAQFLQAVAGYTATRQIVNISSGAGRGATTGWGVYCATKAALDMYSRVVKAEQGADGVKVVSLAPGVVDTDMQANIRASDPSAFPSVGRFQEMHQTGKLASAENVAARILTYLNREDFGNTEIDDIRNYD
jgi:benzil reductase ((S)-benzoin forming)